jgi:hypothetical protein
MTPVRRPNERVLRTASTAPITTASSRSACPSLPRSFGVEAMSLYRHVRIGSCWNTRRITADGPERTFALYHLAAFLLASLLLDEAAAARLWQVSADLGRPEGGCLDDPGATTADLFGAAQ